MNNTAIVLFAYSRVSSLIQVIDSLKNNPESKKFDLIVFSDAPKSEKYNSAVKEVRDYLPKVCGFLSVSIYYREENFGLSKNIIEGISDVLSSYERVIVLEDDIVVSPFFLRFMNEALDRYSEDNRVISVHGYVYPVQMLPEAFFLRGADCWGWATWRRGWKLFNPDGQFLFDELKRKKQLKAFDFNGAFSYSGMLQDQINGLNDSWAVRWHASAFLANKLTLYPGRSLVNNIGNDGSGTHCASTKSFYSEFSKSPIRLDEVIVEESVKAKKIFEDFFWVRQRLFQRIRHRLIPQNIRQKLIFLAKNWLPPVIVLKLRRHFNLGGGITFKGPFGTWDEATNHSSGYDGKQILEKVLNVTLKVKRGEAVFERDSVIFDKIQYAWPVTACLMWVAARNEGRLSVLDFGGSLGTSYFQNRGFLKDLPYFRWSVVEQEHFVDAGRKHIQDDRLIFYSTITECLVEEKPNFVLLSSVLQYIKDPYAILDEIIQSDVEIILIDRTPFHEGGGDIVAVQNVPESIYSASYPMWILSKKSLISHLSKNFILMAEDFSPEGFIPFKKTDFSFSGIVMRRRYYQG